MKDDKENIPKEVVRQTNSYLRYMGLGTQLGLTILAGALIGKWLDNKFEMPKPYLTTFFSLFFLAGGFYVFLRDLIKISKNKQQ
jgi:uncharacterized membrane protein YfcA